MNKQNTEKIKTQFSLEPFKTISDIPAANNQTQNVDKENQKGALETAFPEDESSIPSHRRIIIFVMFLLSNLFLNSFGVNVV